MRVPRPGTREGGFTLAEVLVAVVIEALIVGALGMAFLGIFKGTTQVNQSLSRSGDARIAAAYIVSDARNSSGPEISLTSSTCTDGSLSGTATLVVQFGFDTTSVSGTTTADVVDYFLVTNTGGAPYSLYRRECKAGSLVSDSAVGSNVQSVTAVCSPTANCTGSPTSITVTVTETTDSSGQTYQYSLTGTFRKLIGDGPPAPSGPAQSVILLGSGGSCSLGATGITVSGAASMNVYGNAYINTADGASCKAMSLSNSGTFHAGKTNILTGGTCTWSGGTSCPTVTNYSPAITDPYASLTAPSTSGLPSQTGCTGAEASQTASPGVYASGFTLGGGDTCTLASGIYIIQGSGFNVANGATLKTGAGGVLIYVTTGAFAVAGGANITLTAMTSGTYAGIALWQAAADTSTISWSNGGALVFNGSIYAPKAQLNISGNAQTPIVTSLVVQTVVLTNSGGITVGSPLTISAPTSLQSWTVGQAYPSTASSGSGGGGAYTWSATLPAGLAISSTKGTITGTPTAAGTTTAVVTLNDAAGDTADSNSMSITINAAPSIPGSSLANGDVNVAYSDTLSGSGGTAPYAWSQTGLPAGLSLNSSTGAVTGTPTSTGPSTVAVTLTDAAGATVNKNISLAVNLAPSITTASLATGEKSVAYNAPVAGTDGATPYTWSATGLPAGLSISASTGVISGTPTASGSFTAAVTLTDAMGATANKNLSLTINLQPTITSVAIANGTGTSGTADIGDTVTIVYSAQMKVASFCNTWSNDANNQTLNADNLVTVAISNANPDVLTVSTASGCTFNLGSINLKSNSYVTGATTFKGAGASKSTIAWTASTHTLVITLGAMVPGGAVANVPGNTSPIYTASGSIQDSQGAVLSNSPFTLSPAAKRF